MEGTSKRARHFRSNLGRGSFFAGLDKSLLINMCGVNNVRNCDLLQSKRYAEKFFQAYMGGWLVGFFSKTKFFL